MSDSTNPDMMYQLTSHELLIKIVDREIDPIALARAELRKRNLSEKFITVCYLKKEKVFKAVRYDRGNPLGSIRDVYTHPEEGFVVNTINFWKRTYNISKVKKH